MSRVIIAGLMAAVAIATIAVAGMSYFMPVSAQWGVTDRAWLTLQFFDGRVRLFWITSPHEAIDVVPVSPGPQLLVQPTSTWEEQAGRANGEAERLRRDSSFLIRVGDRRAVGPFGGQWRTAVPRRVAADGDLRSAAGRDGGRTGQGVFVELSYVRMPFWIPVVVLLFHPVRSLMTGPWRQRRRRRRNQCLTCGYSLTGNTSGICPECGTAIPE